MGRVRRIGFREAQGEWERDGRRVRTPPRARARPTEPHSG